MESQKQKEFEECEKRLEELTNSTKPIPISTTSASSKSNYSITNIKSSFASIVNDRPTLSKPIPGIFIELRVADFSYEIKTIDIYVNHHFCIIIYISI